MTELTQQENTNQRGALTFIFITLFIDVLGMGIIIPVLPELLQNLAHVDVATATRYSGYLTFVYATMQFLFSPVLGNLSDQYGRKPILIISLFGFGIDYLFMAFAPSLVWLFVGRTISGIAGASKTTATAYIADVSTGDKRAANFGLVGAASGLGLIVGIAMGSYLGHINIKFPFIAAAAFALLNALYGLFVLPESLAKEHRRKFEWSHANPVSALARLFKFPALAGLSIAFLLVYIAQKAVEYLLSFFLIEKFQWSLPAIGSLGIYIGVLLVGIQAGLIRVIIPKFGQKKSIVAGLLFYTIGLTLIAFVNRGWLMYVYIIPYCLGGISGPALQGMITSQVARNEQGALQGALTSIDSISVIIGPLALSLIFYHFTNKEASLYFPGAPYLAGAILMLISTVLVPRSFKKS